MLSPTRVAHWCAVLTIVGSSTLAQVAVADPEAPPEKPEKAENAKENAKKDPDQDKHKDKEKPKDSGDAEDLARTLEQGNVEPVSRVMGQRIVASAVNAYIHGTLVVDWRWGDGSQALPNTFELRESHVYMGAHILDVAQAEVFFELEKKSQTDVPLNLRYGQLDVRVLGNLLVLRGGLFLVPFGVYNTEIFLRYDAKLPERPEIHRRIVAGSWSEIGVQAFGRWEWSPGRALRYAAYVTNGQDGTRNTSRASYEPVYRSLTGAKSAGLRIAVEPLEGLALGASGYRGSLAGVDGALNLGALDFIFRHGPFSTDGEAVYGWRLDPGGPVPEGGFYVTAAYKITSFVEPVIGAGATSTGPTAPENELDLDVGVNVYPFADRFPTAVLKAAYQREMLPDGTGGNGVTAAFVIGF